MSIEKYKISVKERQPFTLESLLGDVLPTVDHIAKLRKHIELSIARMEKIKRQREAAATAAYEYLRSHLTELDHDENRRLLVLGCEASLDEIEKDIKEKAVELFSNLTDYKQHVCG